MGLDVKGICANQEIFHLRELRGLYVGANAYRSLIGVDFQNGAPADA